MSVPPVAVHRADPPLRRRPLHFHQLSSGVRVSPISASSASVENTGTSSFLSFGSYDPPSGLRMTSHTDSGQAPVAQTCPNLVTSFRMARGPFPMARSWFPIASSRCHIASTSVPLNCSDNRRDVPHVRVIVTRATLFRLPDHRDFPTVRLFRLRDHLGFPLSRQDFSLARHDGLSVPHNRPPHFGVLTTSFTIPTASSRYRHRVARYGRGAPLIH